MPLGPRATFAAPLRIDLNSASVPELMTLPGVGRQRATAIVLHRVRHGRFLDLSEVMEVDGFGELAYLRLRGFLQPISR